MKTMILLPCIINIEILQVIFLLIIGILGKQLVRKQKKSFPLEDIVG
jgi:hypothetical protein